MSQAYSMFLCLPLRWVKRIRRADFRWSITFTLVAFSVGCTQPASPSTPPETVHGDARLVKEPSARAGPQKRRSQTANPEQLRRLRQATSALRKRRYDRQLPIELSGVPTAVSKTLPAISPSKLLGYEIFNNMAALNHAPGLETIRLRYISLLYGDTLSRAIKTSFAAQGWSANHIGMQGSLVTESHGKVEWSRIEPVDKPSQIDFKLKDRPISMPMNHVTMLMSSRPKWWDSLPMKAIYGFEYSRFHHFKKVAAFTDLERVAIGFRQTNPSVFKAKLYAAAKAENFTAHTTEANVLVQPPNTTLTVTMPTPDRVIVHYQKRWISKPSEGSSK
ncbi:MAG: hypothetical protein VX589_12335 [Myxococcota bacterium]|nr:hypothetical protein [Myxococcota bacterium]